MPIDLTAEAAITLSQAARALPPGRGGRPVHPSTILRWVLHGVRGPDGSRVRLGAVRLGGRWLTSREALGRFAAEQTGAPGRDAPGAGRPAGRAREVELQLDRIGL